MGLLGYIKIYKNDHLSKAFENSEFCFTGILHSSKPIHLKTDLKLRITDSGKVSKQSGFHTSSICLKYLFYIDALNSRFYNFSPCNFSLYSVQILSTIKVIQNHET